MSNVNMWKNIWLKIRDVFCNVQIFGILALCMIMTYSIAGLNVTEIKRLRVNPIQNAEAIAFSKKVAIGFFTLATILTMFWFCTIAYFIWAYREDLKYEQQNLLILRQQEEFNKTSEGQKQLKLHRLGKLTAELKINEENQEKLKQEHDVLNQEYLAIRAEFMEAGQPQDYGAVQNTDL